jgi:Ca2+-binding RTX toxin-like protein
VLRGELVKSALDLGLDLRGFENPADGVNAMMAVDGSVVLEGRRGNDNYWAYGAEAEKIRETKDGGEDTLWYLGGPDGYVLHCPMNVENIRIATVLARHEDAEAARTSTRMLRIVAHPDSPIHFETTERVMVSVRGSRGDDVMIGPKYGGATFYGGEGDDVLRAISVSESSRHFLYGGAGNDRLVGGGGRDVLDGGTGDDTIIGTAARNRIFGGHGNDEILDGDGSSVVQTGPGRNRVRLGGGNDTVHAGTGINLIDAGPGAVVFVLAYGGVTHVSQWQPEQVYDLTAWPKPPEITRRADWVDVTLGLSVLRISGVPEGHDLTTQIRQGAE